MIGSPAVVSPDPGVGGSPAGAAASLEGCALLRSCLVLLDTESPHLAWSYAESRRIWSA